MKYQDIVYGKTNITEPVILELINAPSLQRLKKIDQGGYRVFYREKGIKITEKNHNRFNHSVGVFLLLHRYNAPIEEQIIGLIHDISHSVFSHCIDYVTDNINLEKNQSSQDDFFDKFIKSTEIPKIIKKHGFDINYILDNRNFPLEERNIPDLCADRIDYSLRDALLFKIINQKEKEFLLDNLFVEDKQWVFKNLRSAKEYAKIFLKLNNTYWSSLNSAIMLKTVGDFLKYFLEKKYITKKDLYTTDQLVLEKIKPFLKKDEKAELLWKRMNKKTKIINNPQNYDIQVFCKSRVVDPLFKENGKIQRISKIDSLWKKIVHDTLEPRKYFLKFE